MMNKHIEITLPTTIRIPICLAFLLLATLAHAQAPAFDLIITRGHIIDGTGSPWYSGDLGIRDGKIAAIGNLSAAPRKRTIDAAGKVVAPGFIDMLGQSELTILVDPRLPSKIYQGITSEITGEGNSIAPLNDAIIQTDHTGYDHYKIRPDWRTFASILRAWKSRAWASTWQVMSERRKSAAWCSARTIFSPRLRNLTR
jgi:N-acyl-D-aspartate/D-glutamate deacylase